MRGLLEFLVVVDAERACCGQIRAQAADLWIEETGVDAAEHDESGQTVKIGDTGANRKPADLGVVPGNREGDRRVEQDAEVEGIMSVFP